MYLLIQISVFIEQTNLFGVRRGNDLFGREYSRKRKYKIYFVSEINPEKN